MTTTITSKQLDQNDRVVKQGRPIGGHFGHQQKSNKTRHKLANEYADQLAGNLQDCEAGE